MGTANSRRARQRLSPEPRRTRFSYRARSGRPPRTREPVSRAGVSHALAECLRGMLRLRPATCDGDCARSVPQRLAWATGMTGEDGGWRERARYRDRNHRHIAGVARFLAQSPPTRSWPIRQKAQTAMALALRCPPVHQSMKCGSRFCFQPVVGAAALREGCLWTWELKTNAP
jgi:hypothetical protein